MKRKIMIVITSIIGILAIALAIILPIAIHNGTGIRGFRNIKIHQINGESSIVRNTKSLKAYKDMNLRNGDTIQTGADAELVLRLDEDKYIYVGKNSNVDLTSIKNTKTRTVLRVNVGSIVSEVKNKLTDLEEFEVETPNSTMAIRGTTFAVDVENKDDEKVVTYRLAEGKIELSVLDQFESIINAGIFNMLPMEQITITATNDGIIEGADLTEALSNKGTDNYKETTYQSVVDYISQSNNVSLVFKELTLDDIVDIQRVLPYNRDNEIRCVSIYSTFDVNNEKDLVVYDSTKKFTINAHAMNKRGYLVTSWKVNGETVSGGKDVEIVIDKTSLIEPIYEEATPYNILINSNYFNNEIYVNDELITEATVMEIKGYADIKVIPNEEYDFIGLYESNGNMPEVLISTETEFSYLANKDSDIVFVFATNSGTASPLSVYDEDNKITLGLAAVTPVDLHESYDPLNYSYTIERHKVDSSVITYTIKESRSQKEVSLDELQINETYEITFMAVYPHNTFVANGLIKTFDSSKEADVVVTSSVYGGGMVKVNDQEINSEYSITTSNVKIEVYYDNSEYSYLGIYYYNPLLKTETLITTNTTFEEDTFEGSYYYNVKFITGNLDTYNTYMYYNGEFVSDEYMSLSYQQEFDPFNFDFEVQGGRNDEEPYPYDSATIKAADAKELITCEIRNENQQIVDHVDTSALQSTYMISYYLNGNENIRWNLTVTVTN